MCALSDTPSESLLRHRGYVWLWTSASVSALGTYLTQLAMSVLAVEVLRASAVELGLIRAAQWVPYLLFGVIAGALVDRVRRRPVLVAADLGRAVLLALVPLLYVADLLSIPVLIGVVAAVGLLSLTYDAAYQSYLPRLVPRSLLTRANARLEQSGSVAQSVGPLVAGGLVQLVGAAATIALDAVSYLLSGLAALRARTDDPEPRPVAVRRHLLAEMREGVRWVYRHPGLRPMALGSHGWFLFNSMVTTIYVLLALRTLNLGALGLGVTLALAGLGGVLGGALSTTAERRLGIGGTLIAEQWLCPAAYLLLPLAPEGTGGLVCAAVAQFLFGVAITIGSPMQIGYRQAVTPDALQARTNATIRSFNWGMIAIGAPIGGLLADALGSRNALWLPIAGLALVALAMSLSNVRRIRTYDDTGRRNARVSRRVPN